MPTVVRMIPAGLGLNTHARHDTLHHTPRKRGHSTSLSDASGSSKCSARRMTGTSSELVTPTLRSEPSESTPSSDSRPSSPRQGLAELPTVTWRVTSCCFGCALTASCLCNSCELHAGDGNDLRGDLSGRSPSASKGVVLQGRRGLLRPFALAFALVRGLPWSASMCNCRHSPHWCTLF